MTHPTETSSCPTVDFVYKPASASALQHFAYMDFLQAVARPAAWPTESGGYWIFADHKGDNHNVERIFPQLRDSCATTGQPTIRSTSPECSRSFADGQMVPNSSARVGVELP